MSTVFCEVRIAVLYTTDKNSSITTVQTFCYKMRRLKHTPSPTLSFNKLSFYSASTVLVTVHHNLTMITFVLENTKLFRNNTPIYYTTVDITVKYGAVSTTRITRILQILS